MSEALQDIVNEELAPLGLELFELHSRGTRSRPVLDVRVERADGTPVTVADCARASRAIEAKLDQGVVAGSRYVLEVSSPGLERPLRNAADWRRFVGRDAVVTGEWESGGLASREGRIAALDGVSGSETITIEDGKGLTHRIPLVAVKKARLAFNWKR